MSKKNNVAVLHLPLGKNEKVAKNILYFLRLDRYATCEFIITDKPKTLNDWDGLQEPCNLRVTTK